MRRRMSAKLITNMVKPTWTHQAMWTVMHYQATAQRCKCARQNKQQWVLPLQTSMCRQGLRQGCSKQQAGAAKLARLRLEVIGAYSQPHRNLDGLEAACQIRSPWGACCFSKHHQRALCCHGKAQQMKQCNPAALHPTDRPLTGGPLCKFPSSKSVRLWGVA